MTSVALSMDVATEVLEGMLIDAYLDQISAHSIQATLRFISDRIRPGARTAVDLAFTCDAEVTALCESTANVERDFFAKRACFLSRVHGLIGKTIMSLQLRADGALTLNTGSSSILLTLSKDDYADDDWIWKVQLEEGANLKKGLPKALCCCVEDGSIGLYAI